LTLGQKLKERRIVLNLTLRELAKKVSADFTYLSKIENDKTDHPPSEDLLRRLAKHLETDADELIMLSGQVPEDIRESITKSESAVQFFRSVREKRLDWDNLNEMLEDHSRKKKR